jgi:hypothetical protein
MKTCWMLVMSIIVVALGGCTSSPTETAQSEDIARVTPKSATLTPLPDTSPALSNPGNASPSLTPAQGKVTGMTPAVPVPVDPYLQSLIEKAKGDLAKRLSLSITEISLVGAAGVDWPDSSLGCPQKDMQYTQGIVSGFRIILKVNGKDYFYHTDRTNQIVNCPEDNSNDQGLPSFPVPPGSIQDGKPWMPVN